MTKYPAPIGLSFPLRLGSAGYFEQTFNNVGQARASILNLFNTRIGERPLNPRFGSRIYEFLFEPEVSQSLIQQIIQEEVSYWIPSVTVQSVVISLSNADVDNYTMNIQINFTAGNESSSAQLNVSV